ncbi:hypothetical protein KY321_02050, partial [Candidatus Woesearchaeota archaeon]|nr:hypothetical protein [Candidatus Woesearchaeota archaeon]
MSRVGPTLADEYGLEFRNFKKSEPIYRTNVITEFCNLMQEIVSINFGKIKKLGWGKNSDLSKYFRMLPSGSELRKKFLEKTNLDSLIDKLVLGSVDVNVMSKLNVNNTTSEDSTYNEAIAAINGYAKSNLNTNLVLSAGADPGIASYLGRATDLDGNNPFIPNEQGIAKKGLILKVTDYRSSRLQAGRILAKQGLVVKEFRIESGLAAGGHLFPTQGKLLGPILEEFKENKNNLNYVKEVNKAREKQGLALIEVDLKPNITYQGSVSTYEELELLEQYYGVGVGIGTPFLTVDELGFSDKDLLEYMIESTNEDVVVGNCSPITTYMNLRFTSSEFSKFDNIDLGTPGANCRLGHAKIKKLDDGRDVCAASKIYQKQQLKKLDKLDLNQEQYEFIFNKVVDCACICDHLTHSLYKLKGIETNFDLTPTVCPGPNLAEFDKNSTFEEMINHFYGRKAINNPELHENMFVRELSLYLDLLENQVYEFNLGFEEEVKDTFNLTKRLNQKHFLKFKENLNEGINYYLDTLADEMSSSQKVDFKSDILEQANRLNQIMSDNYELFNN